MGQGSDGWCGRLGRASALGLLLGALGGCGGAETEIAELMDTARREAGTPRALCGLLDDRARQDLADLAAEVRIDGARGCAAGVLGASWVVDPVRSRAPRLEGIADRVRVDGDDALVAVHRNREPVRLRRQSGRWRIALTVGRPWTRRAALARACGAAARRLTTATVPGGSTSAYRTRWRDEARDVSALARRVARTRPTSRPDRDARRTVVRLARRQARLAREAADRVTGARVSLRAAARDVARERRSLVTGLDAEASDLIAGEVGGCSWTAGEGRLPAARDVASVDRGVLRAERACAGMRSAVRATLRERGADGTRAAADRRLRAVRSEVERLEVPRELAPVRRQLLGRVAETRTSLRVFRGGLVALADQDELNIREYGVVTGLRQLGVGCVTV